MAVALTLAQWLPDYPFTDSRIGALSPSGLTMDSRAVKPGMAFLACRGGSVNGADYIAQAEANGAAVVLIAADQKAIDCQLPLIRISELEQRLGDIAARFYGHPSQHMQVIGVTGTNGKTSVSHFVAQMLNSLNQQTAVLGTVGYGFLGQLQTASHTTPDVLRVHEMMDAFYQAGAQQVAMEVSSHALEQQRVNQVAFDQAVLTNLTRDHLDYHGSMDAYGAAKLRLFTEYPIRHAVLNLDDPFAERVLQSLPKETAVTGYGMSPSKLVDRLSEQMICMERYQLTASGIRGEMSTAKGRLPFQTALIGRFNLSNLMASVATLLWQGFSLEQLQAAISEIQGVAGRMETVTDTQGRLLVIDYAHTPDALAKVLGSLREHAKGRLICVFGCGGDRDKGKRPLMAAVAEQYADTLIVTNDNPRSEAPEVIAADILAGLTQAEKAQVCLDRQEAIAKALSLANTGDVVLVAGKGHEDYQEVQGQRTHFSDREAIQACLEETR